MTEALRQQLTGSYDGISLDCEVRPDHRGMMNRTYYVGEDKVLTLFQNRPPEQVVLIAEIVGHDSSGLLPPVIMSKAGPVAMIDGIPAIMWKRLSGNHFVRRDHSDKVPISEEGHASVAESFWKVHASLAPYTDRAGQWLGQVHYLPAPETGEPAIEFSELPDFLQTGLIVEYFQTGNLPLKYPALVHHDMERQNFLHDEKGLVTGIVDADSFKRGDLLFEYCRCMMNFMFSDPDYKPFYADHYMRALLNAGIVDGHDIEIIPKLIRAFVAKDLLDYCRYESNPPKTNLSRLAAIYDKCLKRVDAYFSDPSLPVLITSAVRPSGTPARLPKPEGPR